MTEFETLVLSRLDSIGARLDSIEERFEEATSFASDLMNDKKGVLGSLDIGGLMSSLSPTAEGDSDSGSLQELSGALHGFRERLEAVKQAIVNSDSSLEPDGE